MSDTRRIYVASSWRCVEQPRIVALLRGAGHEVYDFRNPSPPAVARVQGETDSFGCEMHDLCAECLASFRAETIYNRLTRADLKLARIKEDAR